MRREKLDVLVVDDQPGVRYLLNIVIEEAGHRVRTAQNGLEAIDAVRSAPPDLVFMDVRMPLMGGLEALGKIKMLSPKTQVVIMTAYISDETVVHALQKGAHCCIAKPFDVDEIKQFVDEFYWKINNKEPYVPEVV